VLFVSNKDPLHGNLFKPEACEDSLANSQDRETMLEHVLPPFSAASLGLTSLVPAIQSNDLGNGLHSSAPAAPDSGLDHLKAPIVEHVQEIEPDAPEFDLNATRIKSSPYSDPLNFLNLTELDQPLRLFALALTKLQNTRPDYATAPYMSSFDWDEVFSILRGLCEQTGTQWQRTDFYVVIFRSKLRVEADRARLGELDQMSHQEACASGGLLTYWFGSPDGERRNLATCKSCSGCNPSIHVLKADHSRHLAQPRGCRSRR
jgi:hypothetical protein